MTTTLAALKFFAGTKRVLNMTVYDGDAGSGQIRTEGEKRPTTYYPADGKASRPAPAPAAPRRRKKK